MEIVTSEEKKFFEENGYLLVKNVLPKENCEAVIEALFWFLGMDRDNPADWYREPLPKGGMVEMYHHQTMWDNRQHPRMHQVFSELIGNENLWVTLDRVNLKPPYHPDHPEYDHHGFIHWDVDTSNLDIPFWVQGVLYLEDTTAEMGGFQCVPGFHRNLKEWIAQQPADRNPRMPDLSRLPEGMKVTPIPGEAGDLLIWNRLLEIGRAHV